MKRADTNAALIAAYRLIEYAKEQGAYLHRGGNHYIETSLVTQALAEALGLDYMTATRTELETKIQEFENETR